MSATTQMKYKAMLNVRQLSNTAVATSRSIPDTTAKQIYSAPVAY
jgi:hypothetical protein